MADVTQMMDRVASVAALVYANITGGIPLPYLVRREAGYEAGLTAAGFDHGARISVLERATGPDAPSAVEALLKSMAGTISKRREGEERSAKDSGDRAKRLQAIEDQLK